MARVQIPAHASILMAIPSGRLHPAHRDLLTGVISVLALAIVVTAASGRVPASFFPATQGWVISGIPYVNVVISVLAIGTIVTGWRAIRAGQIRRHRSAMIAATALFGIFLTLYCYRLAVLGGHVPFDGPSVLYRYVYLPLLGVHVLLAIVCVPLLIDALAHAATVPTTALAETRHPTVGRVAAALWIISYVLGICVFVLLRLGS